jgi:hypothetical protein
MVAEICKYTCAQGNWAMADEDSVSRVLNHLQDWEEWGRRLRSIAEEVKQKIGEAPLWFNEEGDVFMHPDLVRKLEEHGNEGPMEFLLYMKRSGITKL